MALVKGDYLAAKALQNEGVDTFFYLLSAPIVADCLKLGMNGISVRNETSAGLMAQGYSRLTGKPGIVLSAHGPGTANVVSALANAMADCCPVINFGNSASLRERESGVFQEMDQVTLMRPTTKWAGQVLFASKVPELISLCFRHAMAPPHGPVYLDMPGDAMRQEVEEENVRWPSKYRVEPRAYGDPALVRRAVEMLAAAERPLVVTGSGVLWSRAHEAMQAFVDATGIPFYTTPQGRGVVPEDHPLAFLGARSFAFAQADVVLVVGTRSNNISSFFTAPRWSREAKFIFVNLDPKEIGHNAPAEIGILGDARSVFLQLTEGAKGRFRPEEETPWVRALRERDAQREAQTRALMDSEMRPMHPLRLMKEVRDFIDRDAVLVVDGHETLNFARQSIPTYVPGHRINAGTHGTMGVGVPYAIAAKAAKPDKQVICLTGDGAFGWHGMEIDTAIRHKLNVLFVVCNNGSYTAMDRDKFNPQKFLGFTRYDKMMEALGGCGEYVEEPEDIRPALERAAKAGVPALVNVKVDHYTASRTQIGLHRD
jgi:acetolactate synthase-1/2/3 large subunit